MPRATRTPRKFGICPSFKGHFCRPVPNHSVRFATFSSLYAVRPRRRATPSRGDVSGAEGGSLLSPVVLRQRGQCSLSIFVEKWGFKVRGRRWAGLGVRCTAVRRVFLVGSHGRWKRPCLQTAPECDQAMPFQSNTVPCARR